MKNRVLGAVLCALMLLTLLPVTALAEETEKVYVELTEENFPDANFLAYLKDVYVGQINNNRISVSTVSTIHCDREGIKDLTGIQLFTDLQILNCEDNQLTELDVSNNKKLRIFDCAGNQLTKLDVTENTALTHLTCTDNNLTELDVSKNTALDHLFCNENQLTSLDVSANKALKELYCSDNQLTGLNVTANTANTALTRLYCYKNKLTELDISKNTALTELNCAGNQLTKVDTSRCPNLTELDCTAMTTGALTVDVADRSKLLLSTLGVDAGSVTVKVKGVVQNGVTFGGRMGSYRSTEFWQIGRAHV